jgi:HlyD family secretion protein
VAAQIGGRVKELRIDEGSIVRVADTLAVLDSSGPEIQLRQAQAGVDLAQAQLNLLLNGARSEDIAQAEAMVRQAEINWNSAQGDARRADTLFPQGGATRKQKDDADARLAAAEAQLQGAQQGRDKLRQFARPEDIASARARLAQAQAARDLAQRNVNECFVVAPVNGTVTNKVVELGDLAMPGGVIVSLSRLDTVDVMIYVSEKELPNVKLGAAAEVRIDANPRDTFPGKVVYISPTAEFTPKNIQTREDRVKLVFGVKIAIPNPQGMLKPGLPADAAVKTETAVKSPAK